MLLRFKVKNYKSFKNEAIIDLTAGAIKEHQSSLINVNKINLLPLAAIFGANASGKSNFLDSFFEMKNEVVQGGSVFSPFYFDNVTLKEPTEVEVCIYLEKMNKEVRYGFAKLGKEIVEEWMFSKTFSTTPNLNEKCIYYRKNDRKLETDLKKTEELKEIEFISSMTGNNELILTNLGKRNYSEYAEVYNWFNYNLFTLDFSEINSSFLLYDQELLKMLFNNELSIDSIEDFVKIVDPDILGITIHKELDGNMNDFYTVYSKHLSSDGKELEVPFSSESCGTKKVFSFSLFVASALKNGIVLVCDEFDSKLHPLLLRYFVRMFANKEINVGGGQFIISSHNLICLDSSDLRRDEIWFVEKNNQKSNIFSLYDFKEESIRKDLDFGKHYLSGRFGAIPFDEED